MIYPPVNIITLLNIPMCKYIVVPVNTYPLRRHTHIHWCQIQSSDCHKTLFPHSWLITGFVTRLTQWVPIVEQELLTLPELRSSSPVFSGVRVIRSLVLCVCFVDRYLSFCTFSFGHCVVYSFTILITPFVFSNSFETEFIKMYVVDIKQQSYH